VSERTFRRWRDRLRDDGPEGLRDRRIGKPSSRRAAAEEILHMLGLYEERYSELTVKHFHEQLTKRRNCRLGKPRNRGLTDVVAAGDAALRLAGRKPFPCLGALGVEDLDDLGKIAE
jgi:hypothetical protein